MEWTRATEVTPISDTYFNVTGLHEGIDYEFRVAAENRAGLGSYSDKTYIHKGLLSQLFSGFYISLRSGSLSTSQAIIRQLYHVFSKNVI